MMRFLPVAALTASAICVMSASLKLGVMRCACCAEASDAAVSTASAHTANERKPVTASTPEKARRCGYWLLSPPGTSAGGGIGGMGIGGRAAPGGTPPDPPARRRRPPPQAPPFLATLGEIQTGSRLRPPR